MKTAADEGPPYGAYELKQVYHLNILRGLLASAVLVALMIGTIPGIQEEKGASGTVEQKKNLPNDTIWKWSPPRLTPPLQFSKKAIEKAAFGIPVPVAEDLIDHFKDLAATFGGPGLEGGDDSTGGMDFFPDNGGPWPDEPMPDVFIHVEKDPVCVKRVNPAYPELARRFNIEGMVVARVLVNKEGRVTKVLIQKSDAEVFDDEVRGAAFQWVFTPAIMNQNPVSVWVSVPFRFRLTGGS